MGAISRVRDRLLVFLGARSLCGRLASRMVGKQPLTVFLGAGASVGLGVPSTSTVTDAVLSAMQRAEDCHGIPRSPLDPSPVDALRAQLDLHYPPRANFEHLLHALEAASSLARSWRASTVSRHRIVEAALASGVHPSLITVFNAEFLVRGRAALYSELHRLVDETCSQLTGTSAWPTVKAFYERLADEFDLTIVTTNYDTIVEHALGWGAAEQGFESVSGEPVWRFSRPMGPVRFAKLHGSIHFGYRSGAVDHNRFRFHDDFDDLYWHPTPAEAVRSWSGRSTASSQARRDTTVGPLITGLQKPESSSPSHTPRTIGSLARRSLQRRVSSSSATGSATST